MKCSHCGGSVIYHPGNCLEKAVLKCMACGRPHEGERKMESKTKKCTKCLEEKSLEEFSKNNSTPDGLEYWCKDCKKKRQQDYRDHRAGKGRSHLRAGQRRAKTPRVRDRSGSETKVREMMAKPLPTITRATPEQIIADLRRGLAIEIIEMIQEKFGL